MSEDMVGQVRPAGHREHVIIAGKHRIWLAGAAVLAGLAAAVVAGSGVAAAQTDSTDAGAASTSQPDSGGVDSANSTGRKHDSLNLARRSMMSAGPVGTAIRSKLQDTDESPRHSLLREPKVRTQPPAALPTVQRRAVEQVRAVAATIRAELRVPAARIRAELRPPAAAVTAELPAPAGLRPPAASPVRPSRPDRFAMRVLSQLGSAPRAAVPKDVPTLPTSTVTPQTLPNPPPAADSAESSGVTVGHSTLVLSEADGVTVAADWYYPDSATEPSGVIYLQHGFFRSNKNISALATQLAAQTNSVVVAPTVSSNPLACGGYWINGAPTQQAVANLFTTASGWAELAHSAELAGYTGTLPDRYVLAGHSAGGNLVTGAAGYAAAGGDPPAAVILFDAVDNGGTMAAGLSKLPSTVPVYQIASTPCLCNSFGSGTRALIRARPDQFVGVRLVGGTHVDAEGASTDILASLVCGFSRPSNTSAVPTIAAGWINDVYNGTTDGLYGDPGQRLEVGRATAVVLR